jgi:hypothetical protein
MKRSFKFLTVLLILLFASNAQATDYFGCASAAVNADNTFCATPSGSCAGSDPVSAATALQAGNNLYANGCTITIPNGGSFTATKISTKDGDGAGAAVAGGGFTATANGVTATITANVEGGTTDCLTIGSTTNVVNLTILGNITTDATAGADGVFITGSAPTVTIGASGSPVSITGGGAACYGVYDVSTVTTKTVYANITAGSATSGHGYYFAAASGVTNITGDVTGTASAASGVTGSHSGTATATINGNCTQSSNISYAACQADSSGSLTINGDCIAGTGKMAPCNANSTGTLTVTGNIIGSANSPGIQGKVVWSPSASTKYFRLTGDGSPAYYYLTSNVAGGAHPPVANVEAGVTYGWDGAAVYTGTLVTSSGGGAWAQ